MKMKFGVLAVFGCVAAFALTVSAQTKTVTNVDLEKFRDARLRAENDLRENYAKMGFPSPEELEKQNAEATLERIALFEKLRAARLEAERVEAEHRRLAYEQSSVFWPQFLVERLEPYGLIYGHRVRGVRLKTFKSFTNRGNIGWRATGGGLIYEPGGSSYVRIPGVSQRPVARWLKK